MQFALNHMAAPNLGYAALLDLASDLGCAGVEFRNDLPGALFDGAAPETVAAGLPARDLHLFALAEVKAFHDFTDDTRARAAALMATAQACGAQSIALIPRNDGLRTAQGEARADLVTALRELAPMLAAHNLIGLVEPLGFETCPLRQKADAVEVIEALGQAHRFKLVHDTFHHHLAGGGPIFAAHTAMVHISGVSDQMVSVGDMRDKHRVLIDADDRLNNLSQIAALYAAGYDGPLSFEPFAPEIHALTDPATAFARSIQFIRSGLQDLAALDQTPLKSGAPAPQTDVRRARQLGGIQ